jgi:hypothetical protein
MFLPALKIRVSDAEVRKMISDAKRRDPRVSKGLIEISDTAVQCTRCGMVVLSPDEAWKLEVDGLNRRECPICKYTARLDIGAALTWNHLAKKFLWANLLP